MYKARKDETIMDESVNNLSPLLRTFAETMKRYKAGDLLTERDIREFLDLSHLLEDSANGFDEYDKELAAGKLVEIDFPVGSHVWLADGSMGVIVNVYFGLDGIQRIFIKRNDNGEQISTRPRRNNKDFFMQPPLEKDFGKWEK